MAKQALGLGTIANDNTGDTLRAGGDKINDNFSELYSALGNGTTLTVNVTNPAAGQVYVIMDLHSSPRIIQTLQLPSMSMETLSSPRLMEILTSLPTELVILLWVLVPLLALSLALTVQSTYRRQ